MSPTYTHKWFDDKWLLWIGIPMIGFVIPLIYQLWLGSTTDVLVFNAIGSVMCTAVLWLGCRALLTWVSDRILWEQQPVKRLFVDFITVIAFSFIVNIVLFWILGVIPVPQHAYDYSFWKSLLSIVIISLIVSFTHEGIYFFFQWKRALIRTESLEKENLLSQYETLKNQVNPHFLFNTLNTLITIIEEDKQQAIEYVERLSDFFRSILQLRNRSVITLKEELELIRNYYFIQKKRYGTNLNLVINVDESYLETSVAPLTIQMLIENAIKHNVISSEKPLKIEVAVRNTDYIIIRNNLQMRNEPENGSGLGLENIKNRYKYLSEKKVEIIVGPVNFTVAIPVLHNLER